MIFWVRAQALADSGSLSYEVRIQNTGLTPNLQRALEGQMLTFQNRKRPPASFRQLTLRARADIPRMRAVLKAQGYYEGQATVVVEGKSTPYRILYTVQPGPLYRIGRWTLSFTEKPAHPLALSPPKDQKNQPANAGQILEIEQGFLSVLKDNGYPLAQLAGRQVIVDSQDKLVHIESRIQPGPTARFGHLEIRGLETVNEDFVHKRAHWPLGESFQARRLRELEKDLLDCGLFATVHVHPADTVEPDGSLPVQVDVTERKHRTLRTGVTYVSDDQGLGGQLSWENRNLWGKGQRLRTQFTVSQIDWQESTSFLLPQVWADHTDFLWDLTVGQKDTDAYLSDSIRTTTSLQRHLDRQSTLWGGIGFESLHVEQLDQEERYRLLELPLGLDWDQRNDPLDARRGWRGQVQVIPYLDTKHSLTFLKNYAEISYFHPLRTWTRTVVALRAGAGMIQGASLSSIPADKRFYAGGAGSVRGYAYQSIGPKSGSTPTGGQSLVETSLELRTQWGDRLGSVLFLDGAMVMSDLFRREPGESMRWGTGFGLRYALGFAPLRFDVGFPLNRGRHDKEYQFYVSIGQAF